MRTCPSCGETCAQGWCGFCERMLPQAGCGFGPCGDPDCYLCVVVPRLFLSPVRCPRVVAAGTGKNVHEVLCRFTKGHPGLCKPSTRRVAGPDEAEEEGGEDAWFT